MLTTDDTKSNTNTNTNTNANTNINSNTNSYINFNNTHNNMMTNMSDPHGIVRLEVWGLTTMKGIMRGQSLKTTRLHVPNVIGTCYEVECQGLHCPYYEKVIFIIILHINPVAKFYY